MKEENYKFKTKPFKHQFDGWNISKRNKYFALLMDLGTGKTKVALDTAAYMYDNGWINAIMVFGNNGSYMNWKEAIEEHFPSHIPVSIGIWSSKNTKKQNDDMYKAITKQGMCLRIFLMNIEAIAYPKGFKAACDFVGSNKTLAIVDESTTIKNPKSKRTKAAWKIRDLARARRILTGSPVDNRPLDAWAQFEFLCPGALGFTSFYSFRAQYAELEQRTVRQKNNLRDIKVVTGYKNLDRLKASISKVSFIVKKEDCLDLPPKTDMKYYVELTDEQRRVYEQLKLRSIVELEGKLRNSKVVMDAARLFEELKGFENASISEEFENGLNDNMSPIVSVKAAIVKLLRLHQICCGYVRDDDKVLHQLDSNRIKVLDELLEETRGRTIIWTHFTPDIENIYKHISEKYGKESVLTYHGATSREERDYVKEVFKRGREVDHIRFLIANDKTGGYGNNWTAATLNIYYSYDYDYNIHHQTQDRIHRIGQTEPVTNVYLIARNTIEERMIEVLKNKQNIAELLTQSNWKNLF